MNKTIKIICEKIISDIKKEVVRDVKENLKKSSNRGSHKKTAITNREYIYSGGLESVKTLI